MILLAPWPIKGLVPLAPDIYTQRVQVACPAVGSMELPDAVGTLAFAGIFGTPCSEGPKDW